MNQHTNNDYSCGSQIHFSRRAALKMAGLSGLSWLTPIASQLAFADENKKGSQPGKALILLWLEGAPSQLETFDPHPNTDIAAGSTARKTSVPGVLLDSKFEQLSELMNDVSIVRSVTSKEGDHERALYNVKTGYRPDPTLTHPSIGSVICHQMKDKNGVAVDIPRHISILSSQLPARGGYLGNEFDAFKIGDPVNPVPDVQRGVDKGRFNRRIKDLQHLNDRFNNGATRGEQVNKTNTLDAALKMMSSDQLKAFDVNEAPQSTRAQFGDTPFGRGCLTAIRLIEAGVRCVEVTLSGWDSHANNHEIQGNLASIVDPAYASLIRELKKRDLFDQTIVVCGGEFGRTPQMNAVGGRDHWPHGFSIALSGGGIAGGRIIGETSSNPEPGNLALEKNVKDPQPIENIHATVLNQLGVDYHHEFNTPIQRPIKISEGTVIKKLLADA